MGIIDSVVSQWQATSYLALFAMLSTLGFAWFAGSESKFAWLFGLSNFIISGLLSMASGDYIRGSFLALYTLMSLWGLYYWYTSSKQELYISRLPRGRHLSLFLITLACIMCVCTILFMTTNEAYISSIFFYSFGILALYLTFNKALESWFYWAIINVAGAYISLQHERYLSLTLILFYLPLTVRGLYVWTNRYYAALVQRAEQEEMAKARGL